MKGDLGPLSYLGEESMANVADEFGVVMCAIIATLAILMFLCDD